MPKPPRELVKQIEIVADSIEGLNNLIDNKKIKVENYGKDFMEPLNKIRSMAMELRNNLELFKANMERAVTEQYYSNSRFAGEVNKETRKKVIDKFLSSNNEY